jgi:rod shape-determining protein MreD
MRLSQTPSSTWPILLLTLFIASSLALIPLSPWLTWCRPDWLLLMLCFWALALEGKFPLGVVFITGCYQDLLLGSFFGMHALSYLATIHCVNTFYLRIGYYPLAQQTLIITLFVGVSELIQLWVNAIKVGYPHHLMVWGSTLITLFAWPLLAIFLKGAQKRSIRKY